MNKYLEKVAASLRDNAINYASRAGGDNTSISDIVTDYSKKVAKGRNSGRRWSKIMTPLNTGAGVLSLTAAKRFGASISPERAVLNLMSSAGTGYLMGRGVDALRNHFYAKKIRNKFDGMNRDQILNRIHSGVKRDLNG